MTTAELSEVDRARLLSLARRSIAATLAGETAAATDASGLLAEKRGAFVTLTERGSGELRGCIGYVEPLFPLAETVSRAAAAAAVHDSRFPPVTRRELPTLAIEISVLSVPRPIRPEDVVIGTHGLIIRLGRHSGLLLPQVAVEHGWNAATLLDQTCRKAGLPPGTWRQAEVELLGFTATVFGEGEAAS